MKSKSDSEQAGQIDGATVPTIDDKLAQWEAERQIRQEHRNAVYVSAPITTGRTFIDWLRKNDGKLKEGTEEYIRAHRAEVILPNTQRAGRFLELLRWRHEISVIIDPTSFDVPGWDQEAYYAFWLKVIERHVRRVVFLNGWHYSIGCAREFEAAQRFHLDCVDEGLGPLAYANGIQLLRSGIEEAQQVGLDTSALQEVVERLDTLPASDLQVERRLFKDDVLDRLAHTANVAQFVSFAPGEKVEQRFCRIQGFKPNYRFSSTEEAVSMMLQRSSERLVNIRSFDPERPEGNPFLKKLNSASDVLAHLKQLGVERRLYTIVNETIDENDGGISGVCHRGLLDFAPQATPRCVDDPDHETCTIPFQLGMRFLQTVYGFEPDLRGREGARIEFSIHPQPRGWLNEHTIIWQSEQRPGSEILEPVRWPNDFSRFLGDKSFGLILASVAGFDVPHTLVVTRFVSPFTFGRTTGTRRFWTRTCPSIKDPGYYPSARGWRDPHKALFNPWRLAPPRERLSRLLLGKDPDAGHPPVASVIVQDAVGALYSGRAKQTSSLEIRGVRGEGDAFMVGDASESHVPPEVEQVVRPVWERASNLFGPVELEWVFDGSIVWIVQMNAPHRAKAQGPEEVREWVEFRFRKGRIEDFRREVLRLKGSGVGIIVVGNVSPLSHLGEIAEIHHVPARFVKE